MGSCKGFLFLNKNHFWWPPSDSMRFYISNPLTGESLSFDTPIDFDREEDYDNEEDDDLGFVVLDLVLSVMPIKQLGLSL